MAIYAVYTRIRKGDGTDKEIIVMNIESTSCGGAEHKILDIHYSITNALAFDMANPVDFINYITHCKTYDYEDFKKRYISTVQKRQESIDEVFDEIKEIQEENNELSKKIYDLEQQIKHLKTQKDNNLGYIEERMTELKEYCNNVNMKMERSKEIVIGIA